MLNASSGCDYLMYTRAFLTIKTCPFLIYPKIAVYADFKNIYFAILLNNNKFVSPAFNLSLPCQTQVDGMQDHAIKLNLFEIDNLLTKNRQFIELFSR